MTEENIHVITHTDRHVQKERNQIQNSYLISEE